MLTHGYAAERQTPAFDQCCRDVQPCSKQIEKIANHIDDLSKMRPMQYVPRIQSMEEAIVTKCEEIKKQKKVVRRLL